MTKPLPDGSDGPDYERLRDRLGRGAPFVDLIGARLDELGPGFSVVSLAMTPSLTNGVGTFHAGALFAGADTAAGSAAFGLLATVARLREVVLVTRNADIDFRQPASSDLLVRATVRGSHDELLDPWREERPVRLPVGVELFSAAPEGARPTWVGTATFTCVAWRNT